ncbi:MAG: rhodanese-like domain-containing protein [Acidimicrobiia bacterium]|nr:rhodanese-like domain-containing protein [Acidimicrobiia bacterium]
MAQRGEALIVDVRERAAYEESHISGALALPESELDTRIGELPRDQLIVTYCT